MFRISYRIHHAVFLLRHGRLPKTMLTRTYHVPQLKSHGLCVRRAKFEDYKTSSPVLHEMLLFLAFHAACLCSIGFHLLLCTKVLGLTHPKHLIVPIFQSSAFVLSAWNWDFTSLIDKRHEYRSTHARKIDTKCNTVHTSNNVATFSGGDSAVGPILRDTLRKRPVKVQFR